MSSGERMVKVDDYEILEGLYYSEDYGWVKIENGKARIGITDYAQKQLKEIIFIELPSEGDEVKQGEAYGSAESVKAVSDLISPLSGKVEEVNSKVLDNPGIVNEDPYGEGWLILITPSNLDEELKNLMDFEKAVEWHRELVKGG